MWLAGDSSFPSTLTLQCIAFVEKYEGINQSPQMLNKPLFLLALTIGLEQKTINALSQFYVCGRDFSGS
jgi:hypothetical protein